METQHQRIPDLLARMAAEHGARTGWIAGHRESSFAAMEDASARLAGGLITLRGREKDMYIRGGFNVYPAEVENHIANLDDVLMVAGIGVPDEVFGETGCYYIVARPGSTLNEEVVARHCREGLADYKVPGRILFRDELPLTPLGKIHKAALRRQTPA